MKERSRVELFESIRRGYRDGFSIRELADSHRVHRRTVRQAIGDAVPPAPKSPARVSPVSAQWESIVRGWLKADQLVHRKQRHTGQRIWERLVAEHDAVISSSTVRALVKRLKLELEITALSVSVPQTHLAADEAEVDFGEFWAQLDGQVTKVHMFVLRLSHSGKSVHFPYSAPSTEAFLDGHVRAFEQLGGVPGRIRYDNLTPAVVKVLLGRERLENPRFIALRSHYGFDSFFCIPGVEGAHEKGGVEGEIGRFRRRHLTPQPVLPSMAALAAAMSASDERDDHRRINGRRETVGQTFATEAPALAVLPDRAFDPCSIMSARVDTKARISVRASHYSVPARLAGRRVEVAVGGTTITVRVDGRIVAEHTRALRKGEQVLNLDHYLEVLIRKPGALAGASALAQAKASKAFTPTHQRFWDAARAAHGDGPGTRILIGVLQLHRTMTSEAVIAGMGAALAAGVSDADVVAAEARRHHDSHRNIPILTPAGTDHATPIPLIAWQRPAPSLDIYDSLLPERT